MSLDGPPAAAMTDDQVVGLDIDESPCRPEDRFPAVG